MLYLLKNVSLIRMIAWNPWQIMRKNEARRKTFSIKYPSWPSTEIQTLLLCFHTLLVSPGHLKNWQSCSIKTKGPTYYNFPSHSHKIRVRKFPLTLSHDVASTSLFQPQRPHVWNSITFPVSHYWWALNEVRMTRPGVQPGYPGHVQYQRYVKMAGPRGAWVALNK